MTLSKSASQVCPLCRVGIGCVLWHTNAAARQTLLFSIHLTTSHHIEKDNTSPHRGSSVWKAESATQFQCGHCCLFKSMGTTWCRPPGQQCCVPVCTLASGDEHSQHSYLWPAEQETAKFIARVRLDIHVILTTQLIFSSALEELRVTGTLLGRIHFLLGVRLTQPSGGRKGVSFSRTNLLFSNDCYFFPTFKISIVLGCIGPPPRKYTVTLNTSPTKAALLVHLLLSVPMDCPVDNLTSASSHLNTNDLMH